SPQAAWSRQALASSAPLHPVARLWPAVRPLPLAVAQPSQAAPLPLTASAQPANLARPGLLPVSGESPAQVVVLLSHRSVAPLRVPPRACAPASTPAVRPHSKRRAAHPPWDRPVAMTPVAELRPLGLRTLAGRRPGPNGCAVRNA